MGNLISCNCNECGNNWFRYQGEGMMVTYYHCNKCGNEISTQNDTDNTDIPNCECGGIYANSDDTVICTSCGSINIETEISGFWD